MEEDQPRPTNSTSLTMEAQTDCKTKSDSGLNENGGTLEAMKAQLLAMEAKVKLYEEKLKQKSSNDGKIANSVNEKIHDKKNSDNKVETLSSQSKSLSTQNKRMTTARQNGSKDFLFGKKTMSGEQKDLLENNGNLRSSAVKRKKTDEVPNLPNKRPAIDQSTLTETYSSLRLVNPLISSVLMDQRMEGRKFILLHQISSKIVNNDIQGDWVTGGVLVEKMSPRTSSSGKTYSIWKLSSLTPGHENKLVSLLLFGKCHTEHWKTQEGMCIALLNPSILPPKEDASAKGGAISIDNPQRLMPLGTSKDFGVCKGVVRKNGSKCKNFVNRSSGDYCEYHIQAEYKKSRANRMEFQFGYGAPSHNRNKGKMMQKLKKNFDEGQFFYGGEVVTLGRPQEKTKVTLKSIMSHSIQAQAKQCLKESSASLSKNDNAKENPDGSEEFKQLLQLPTVGSRNLMKHLKKDEEQEEKSKEPRKMVSITASELLKREQANLRKLKNAKRSISKENEKQSNTPLLGRGCAPDEDIEFADFGDIVSNNLGKPLDQSNFYERQQQKDALARKKACPDYSKEKAKRKAVKLWKERNINDNTSVVDGKKSSPEQRKEIMERVMADHVGHTDTPNNNTGVKKPPKPKGVLSGVFGAIDLNSEVGKKILDAKSSHNNLVKEDEIKRSDLYFKSLEKKEMYEEKMQNITELKVTAYCCKQCKYLAESASQYCKEEKHFVIKVEAKKRFFSCKKCKQRTYALNDRIPNHPCRNCGEINYERVSMYKERQGPKQDRETLLLRGEERKFLNSLK